jgi:hypothetical protein
VHAAAVPRAAVRRGPAAGGAALGRPGAQTRPAGPGRRRRVAVSAGHDGETGCGGVVCVCVCVGVCVGERQC